MGEVSEIVLGCGGGGMCGKMWERCGVWENVLGCGGSSLKKGVREVCWSVGEGEERWGCEKMWEGVGKCVEVWVLKTELSKDKGY